MSAGSEKQMTNIVIDTNVFISAALSPSGTSARIANLVSDTKEIQIFYSKAILAEYIRVLAYGRLNIAKEMQNRIIDTLKKFGTLIEPPTSTIPMPDETDRIFYDTAKASRAILITGNIKHFPKEPFIMTPSEYLKLIIQEK